MLATHPAQSQGLQSPVVLVLAHLDRNQRTRGQLMKPVHAASQGTDQDLWTGGQGGVSRPT